MEQKPGNTDRNRVIHAHTLVEPGVFENRNLPPKLAHLIVKNRAFLKVAGSKVDDIYKRKYDVVFISCSDARAVLGVYLNQLRDLTNERFTTIRSAAQVTSDSTIDSLLRLLRKNPYMEIVLVGHTKCGGVKAAWEKGEHPGKIPEVIKLVDASGQNLAEAEECNARTQARRIESELAKRGYFVKVKVLMLDISTLTLKPMDTDIMATSGIVPELLRLNYDFKVRSDVQALAARHETHTADAVLSWDSRLGFPEIELRSKTDTLFTQSHHGKTQLDGPIIGTWQYGKDHVQGVKFHLSVSHYEDVLQDRRDAVLKDPLLQDMPTYSLLSHKGKLILLD